MLVFRKIHGTRREHEIGLLEAEIKVMMFHRVVQEVQHKITPKSL